MWCNMEKAEKILNDSDEDGDIPDRKSDCKKMVMYKQPIQISYGEKLHRSFFHQKRGIFHYEMAMLGHLYRYSIFLNIFRNIECLWSNILDKCLEMEIKCVKDNLANVALHTKPFVEVFISCMEIESADSSQRPVTAAKHLEKAFSTAEHLEPCHITALLWRLKGFFLWYNLDKPAFCTNPLAEFKKIDWCLMQYYHQLVEDMNKGGLSTCYYVAIALVCIIKVKLMLPAYLHIKHHKISDYIKRFQPSWEQLKSASSALMTLKKEIIDSCNSINQILHDVLKIFLKIRLIDYLRNTGDERGALKILDELWRILKTEYSLLLFGLSKTVQTLLEERERDLRKSRIVAIQGPPALPQEKVDTEAGSSMQEMSNNSSSVNSAE